MLDAGVGDVDLYAAAVLDAIEGRVVDPLQILARDGQFIQCWEDAAE